MDPNRKRRARKLGTELGATDPEFPELLKLGDAELLESYERESSGEAQREREREQAARGPFDYVPDPNTDEQVIADYHASSAEYAAHLLKMTDAEFAAHRRRNGSTFGLAKLIAAELERRTPKPTPVVVPAPEVVEPHPIALETPAPTPPPTAPKAPATAEEAEAAERERRRLEREARIAKENAIGVRLIASAQARLASQDERDAALAKASEDDPMVPGSTRVAPNATPELRDALRGKQQ